MRLAIGWLMAGLLVGCAVAEPLPQWPAPTPVPSGALSQGPSPVASALLGPEEVRWAIGEGGVPEPAVGGGVTDPALKQFTTLRLARDGVALRLTRGDCGDAIEVASGVPVGNQLRLDGTEHRGRAVLPLVYDLTFDPSARRFRGTRNGQPVWLASTEDFVRTRGPLCTMTAVGRLYDAAGNPLTQKATLRIVSLIPSNPYERTDEVTNGTYRVNGLPGLIQLVFTIEAPGMLTLSRHVLIESGPEWTVNFGGPKADEDPDGWKFPLEPVVKPSPAPSGPSPIQLF
ncbi:hypothetical protein D3C72_603830 [compost metagenome]